MSLSFDWNTTNGIEKNDFQINLEALQNELVTPLFFIPYSTMGTGILMRYDKPITASVYANRNDVANTILKYPKLKLTKASITQNGELTNTVKAQIKYVQTGQTTELEV